MTEARALVIDDNVQNLRVMIQMLARQGVSSVEFANPTMLYKVLPTLEQIDVAFLDLEMPVMNGYVVKDLLREKFGEIPIIAYTVHLSEVNVVRRLGFNGFLAKPLNSDRFPGQLARILRGEAVWDRA